VKDHGAIGDVNWFRDAPTVLGKEAEIDYEALDDASRALRRVRAQTAERRVRAQTAERKA